MSEQRPGNAEFMRDALHRFERPLTRYAMRLLGGDLERARDVVQDTFLRLWKADRAQVESHLAEWLYTVCRNRAIDVKRKEGRVTVLTTTGPEDRPPEAGEASEGPAPGPSPLEVVSHKQRAERVAEALETLSPRHQELIRLKFEHGLSYREISSVTGDSVSNVGYLLHTAIQKLRKQVDPKIPALAMRRAR